MTDDQLHVGMRVRCAGLLEELESVPITGVVVHCNHKETYYPTWTVMWDDGHVFAYTCNELEPEE